MRARVGSPSSASSSSPLGVFVLLFVAWELWWTDVTANRAQAVTVQRLVNDFTDAPVGRRRPPRRRGARRRGLRHRPDPALRRRLRPPGLRGHRPRHVDQGSRAVHRDRRCPARSATSPSPDTGRPTADRSTRSQRLRNGDRIIVETAERVRTSTPVTSHEIVAPTDTDGHRAGAGPARRDAEHGLSDPDDMPPRVQRPTAVHRPRPARRDLPSGDGPARATILTVPAKG